MQRTRKCTPRSIQKLNCPAVPHSSSSKFLCWLLQLSTAYFDFLHPWIHKMHFYHLPISALLGSLPESHRRRGFMKACIRRAQALADRADMNRLPSVHLCSVSIPSLTMTSASLLWDIVVGVTVAVLYGVFIIFRGFHICYAVLNQSTLFGYRLSNVPYKFTKKVEEKHQKGITCICGESEAIYIDIISAKRPQMQ